jgi:hypothetical protein
MNVVATHLVQAVRENHLDILFRSAVKKQGRGNCRFELQVDFGGMTLICTNKRSRVVEGKSLLVVGGHDFVEIGACNRKPIFRSRGEQFLNGDPAAWSERQAKRLRFVAQVFR